MNALALPTGTRPIPGFDGRYAIDSSGVIWSRSIRWKGSEEMWRRLAAKGPDIDLRIGTARRRVRIHALLAEVWPDADIPEPPPEAGELREIPGIDPRFRISGAGLVWSCAVGNSRAGRGVGGWVLRRCDRAGRVAVYDANGVFDRRYWTMLLDAAWPELAPAVRRARPGVDNVTSASLLAAIDSRLATALAPILAAVQGREKPPEPEPERAAPAVSFERLLLREAVAAIGEAAVTEALCVDGLRNLRIEDYRQELEQLLGTIWAARHLVDDDEVTEMGARLRAWERRR